MIIFNDKEYLLSVHTPVYRVPTGWVHVGEDEQGQIYKDSADRHWLVIKGIRLFTRAMRTREEILKGWE